MFAAFADIANKMGLQVDVGDSSRQPGRPVHHLAAHDCHMQRRDRTPDDFGKHRREYEMILATDENDLDLRRNFSFEMLSERHTAESASDDNHSSFTHRSTSVYLDQLSSPRAFSNSACAVQ